MWLAWQNFRSNCAARHCRKKQKIMKEFNNLEDEDQFVIMAFSHTIKNNPSLSRDAKILKNCWKEKIFLAYKSQNHKTLNPLKLIFSARKFWRYLSEYERFNEGFLKACENYEFVAKRYSNLIQMTNEAREYKNNVK